MTENCVMIADVTGHDVSTQSVVTTGSVPVVGYESVNDKSEILEEHHVRATSQLTVPPVPMYPDAH